MTNTCPLRPPNAPVATHTPDIARESATRPPGTPRDTCVLDAATPTPTRPSRASAGVVVPRRLHQRQGQRHNHSRSVSPSAPKTDEPPADQPSPLRCRRTLLSRSGHRLQQVRRGCFIGRSADRLAPGRGEEPRRPRCRCAASPLRRCRCGPVVAFVRHRSISAIRRTSLG